MSTHQQHIGKNLLRNKSAVFGLIIIGTSLFVAVTAYFISPDSSPDANRMIVEIGGRKPGFTQEFLVIRKERMPDDPSFFQRLLYGKQDGYNYIPINSYTIEGDSLIIQKFVD